MNLFDCFNDPFLIGLDPRDKAIIVQKLQQWGLHTQPFAMNLDNWFCNFDDIEDKRLALRIFYSLKFYSSEAFVSRLNQLYRAIERHLTNTGNTPSDIVLVTPDGAADSADRHAYDLVKNWELLQNQVYHVSELNSQTFHDPVFILFNDTHGTGNQFLREVWPKLQHYGEHKIYVLAIAISQDALDRFRKEMPRVHVIPQIPVVNARSSFTGQECERLRQLGERVYPKHPMGYGDAALLTAYYYQCPNNTLPIIWADGENNKVNGKAYTWSPLFRYLPKKINEAKTNHNKLLSHEKEQLVAVETRIKPTGKKKPAVLTYRYRVGLLDLDLGLTNVSQVAQELNKCQKYFHFTAPQNTELDAARNAVISIESQRNFSVYEINRAFFWQFDELAVDVVGCFTRYPLAFVDKHDESIRYNYISGPSNIDSRFMFVSAYQLQNFVNAAECSLEEGLVHILVSQLVVYFTDVGFHSKVKECPMDFCQIRKDIVLSLIKRQFCTNCTDRIADGFLLKALNDMLYWRIKRA